MRGSEEQIEEMALGRKKYSFLQQQVDSRWFHFCSTMMEVGSRPNGWRTWLTNSEIISAQSWKFLLNISGNC